MFSTGLGVRVVMWEDGLQQGHLCLIDSLVYNGARSLF